MQEIQWTEEDLRQISDHGITRSEVEHQLELFEEGFPFPTIVQAADEEHGIRVLTEEEQRDALKSWASALSDPALRVLKFVPASGAASRMFRDLFAYMEGGEPTESVQQVLDRMEDFAFYDDLNKACMLGERGKGARRLIDAGEGRTVVRYLLTDEGLRYGSLPKALILFHKYPDRPRTAVEEHLAEGAKYARPVSGTVHLHFTLSPEHIHPFKTLLSRRQEDLEDTFSAAYDITTSTQKPSTDTIAVGPDNRPIRDEEGRLIFRPGGHGSLIENLSEVDADIIFIKNIDNVVPDSEKSSTIIYKQILGGILVQLRDTAYRLMEELRDETRVSESTIREAEDFLRQSFCVEIVPHTESPEEGDVVAELERSQKKESTIQTLRALLNRPIRVCGMVRNEGEPGGGPYIVRNEDGTTSLQILESTQIYHDDPEAERQFRESRFFNPVDLVCCTRDFRGNSFDLTRFVDKSTGFISHKSRNGQPLKALERPGLWNGAMAYWNTCFVEVPADTFNPVKTVNDLLRPVHQAVEE